MAPTQLAIRRILGRNGIDPPHEIPDDMAVEVLNAATILYGSEAYALISEIAMCTGVDRSVTGTDGAGGTFSYDEAVNVQVCHHVSTLQPMRAQRDGFRLTFDVGATEPMFVTST